MFKSLKLVNNMSIRDASSVLLLFILYLIAGIVQYLSKVKVNYCKLLLKYGWIFGFKISRVRQFLQPNEYDMNLYKDNIFLYVDIYTLFFKVIFPFSSIYKFKILHNFIRNICFIEYTSKYSYSDVEKFRTIEFLSYQL